MGLKPNGDFHCKPISAASKIPESTNTNTSGYDKLSNLPDLLDPSNPVPLTMAQNTTTAAPPSTLFQGAASAAALTALGQIMLAHQSTNGPSIGQSGLGQNTPAGLLAATAALTNPELLLFSDPSVLPPPSGGSAGPFAQLLLKAMNSMNPHQAASLVAGATAAAAAAAAAATATVTSASMSQHPPLPVPTTAPTTSPLPPPLPPPVQTHPSNFPHHNPLFPLLHNAMDNAFDLESTQGLNLALKTPLRLMNNNNQTAKFVTTPNSKTTATPSATATMTTGIRTQSPEKMPPRMSNNNHNNNNNDRVSFPLIPNTLFPMNFSWFENPLIPDGLCKSVATGPPSASLFDLSVPSTVTGLTSTDSRKSLLASPPVCSPGLGDLVSDAKQSANLAVYGFEPDGFSDPDGSSSTGSMPGGLAMPGKLHAAGTEHSPNSMNSNPRTRQCDLCNKAFNCSSALRIHYRKHSGELYNLMCIRDWTKNHISFTNIFSCSIGAVPALV